MLLLALAVNLNLEEYGEFKKHIFWNDLCAKYSTRT